MTDDDDRMNRAKRIREMREGNRNGNNDGVDGGADDGVDEKSDEATADDEVADDKQSMEDLVKDATAAAEEDDGDEKQSIEDLVEDELLDDEFEEMDEPGETDEMDEKPDAVDEEMTAEPHDTAVEDEAAEMDDEQAVTDADSAEEDGVSAPLPDTETLEDALEEGDAPAEGDEESAPATGPSEVVDEDTTTQEEETRVLEFTLDDEHYCLDIEYIEEIVKQETITRVPNTPDYIEGVVDLRGQITTILNPKVTLGKENTDADELIVVFDAEAFEDQGYLGWAVDDVRQVSPIVESEVNDPPMQEDYINGVIDREDDEEFVIWTSPDLALEEAE